jgi:vacuolar-type H+-ATPase subunit H
MVDKSYLIELTTAEQAATEIIRRAQDSRDARLKEAKFDAEQELGKFKKELDTEYNHAAEKDASGVDPELQHLQEDYRKKAGEVVYTFKQYKDEAIEFLVDTVFRVNIEVPKVVIGKFD